MVNQVFLKALQDGWAIHGGKFNDFMADLVYRAEGHTEIAVSSEERLQNELTKILEAGEWTLQ